MRVRARVPRLAQRGRPSGAKGRAPPVAVRRPEHAHAGRPPGRYRGPGRNAVVVVYRAHPAHEPAPDEADA
jgi:hypothetical protein